MKARTDKKTLSEALGHLARILPNKSSHPLLTHLKIEAEANGQLHLSGTNLELDMRLHVPAEIDEPWQCAIPAQLLAQHVRLAAGEFVDLELHGSELFVESGGGKARMQTGDVEAFPPLSFDLLEGATECPAAPIAEALVNVRYAASKEAFQAVFRGIKLEAGKAITRFVASDGYRIAIEEAATGLPDGGEWLVPRRSVDDLVQVLKSAHSVRLGTGTGMLRLQTEAAELNVKLLDGDFPSYERVIPSDFKLVATVDADAFKGALQRAGLFADKNANNRLTLSISGGQLELNSEGDYGGTRESISAEVNGEDSEFSACFNAAYLIEAVGPIEGKVALRLVDDKKPMVADGESGNYRGILVPLRV